MVFLKISQYLQETPTQVFSCEYYEISKNTYFEEHLQTAASRFKNPASASEILHKVDLK